MKTTFLRVIVLALALVLCLGLCAGLAACNDPEPGENNNQTNNDTTNKPTTKPGKEEVPHSVEAGKNFASRVSANIAPSGYAVKFLALLPRDFGAARCRCEQRALGEKATSIKKSARLI